MRILHTVHTYLLGISREQQEQVVRSARSRFVWNAARSTSRSFVAGIAEFVWEYDWQRIELEYSNWLMNVNDSMAYEYHLAVLVGEWCEDKELCGVLYKYHDFFNRVLSSEQALWELLQECGVQERTSSVMRKSKQVAVINKKNMLRDIIL